MKSFIGVKVINAKPMSRLDYNNLRGWDVPEDENGKDEGYLVEYKNGTSNLKGYDGYISWSPKKQFEEAYTPFTEGFNYNLSKMEPHEKRVVVEAEELKVKADALSKFILSSPIFSALPDKEKQLLELQHNAMFAYLTILRTRIINFK